MGLESPNNPVILEADLVLMGFGACYSHKDDGSLPPENATSPTVENLEKTEG